jgi:sugar phosphate isomerase/epimerase
MSMPALAAPDALLAHHPLGVSTGYMSESRGNWPQQVAEAWDASPFAVELSSLSEGELDGLVRYLEGNPRLPFHYLSVHGPSKARTMPEEALVRALVRLADRAQAIVMHPDTMLDPVPYRALGRKLVLENMDSRKDGGRMTDELLPWFTELPEAGFCFDIAHAWSLDPSMAVGGELLDAFRTRLRHVHLSSMDQSLHHVPLSEADEELFTPLLHRCLDVPWILEAPPRQD